MVVVDDEDIIKCHVHTNNPGLALEEAVKYGMLCKMKIENMEEQFAARKSQAAKENPKEEPLAYVPVDPEIPYGIVAVAAGEGLQGLFRDLGANQVVSGGQTMNPSTEDILKAIHATPAQNVFVLPNNKNIIMAAEQAVHLADRGVSVVATKTIPQGITAMLSFEDGVSPEENHLQMMKAAEGVHTAQVTFAARDSEVSGERIKKGQLLGMEDGKITLVEDDLVNAAYRVTRRLVKKYNGSLITILYGADTDEATAQALAERLQARFPSVEINVINGGQPVYYFLAAVE